MDWGINFAADVTDTAGLDIAAIITAICGVIFGVTGFITAIFANRQAKKANELAKTSNEIATQALNTAVESNEIAENANKFSQESNALFERQISQGTESHFVDWKCGWDVEEEATIVLKNLGRDSAYNVSVIVTADDFHQVADWPSVEAGQVGVFIPIDNFAEERILFNKEADAETMDMRSSGYSFYTARRFKRTFNVVITWKSSLGVPYEFITEVVAR